jgi:uncharacterized membrane protein
MFSTLLWVHILAGSISLFVGTLVLMLKKGDARHRTLGSVFYYGMTINGVASLALALLHPNPMLFSVGVFSLYLVLTGKRVLQRRPASKGNRIENFDWFLIGTMAVFGVLSVGLGVYSLFQGQNAGIVLCVFGGIGLLLVRQDLQFFKNTTPEPMQGLKIHITKMTGSYIAAFTAFLVVNNTILPGVVAWLLPTVVGTFLIRKWVARI